MTDFSDMLSKAKKMQEQMKKAQDSIKKIEVEGVSGGNLVKVVLGGDYEMKSIFLDQNAKKETPSELREVLLDTMVKSAELSCDYALKIGVPKNKIIVSLKMSEIQDVINVNERFASLTDYPLHLGLTEAGTGVKGIASSAAALAILLQQGIGNTIRVSLTPEPGIPRSREVEFVQTYYNRLTFDFSNPL